jgi:hypothetical protein
MFYFIILDLTAYKISNAGSEGNWAWSHSRENLTDSSWATNFPNTNSSNIDDCGVMIVEPTKSVWKDTTCCSTTIVDQKKVAPICQHDTTCPDGWASFEDRCYLVVRNTTTWANAEQDCKNKGGNLASVHSEEENTFIFNLPTSPIQLWIGGTDAAAEVVIHKHILCTNKSLP